MTVSSICKIIEDVAPLALQESYDNAGLLVGSAQMEVSGILLCIDVTEKVVDEAVEKGCNLVVSHHPLIFSGLKKLIGQNETQRCVIKAIKHDIAIYAAHTNIDNIQSGVNGKIAEKIGLINTTILQPKQNTLLKLVTFVPEAHAEKVRSALFASGAGHIGNYDSCSYNAKGYGTFRANEEAHPFVGNIGDSHSECEIRIEVILPDYMKNNVTSALIKAHPYEEPAYDLIPLVNEWNRVGAGVVGELQEDENEDDFLLRLKSIFNLSVVRHTNFLGKKIKRVAVCGGSGSSFLADAIRAKADIFISGDFKYHEFFNAENKILIADIGHYESEQFTKEIFYEIITKKLPTFAIQISDIKTNPINYL
ncbi:Nif3-like dinuclear metal center hexameric protein [Paludibacter sp. 221]|uniref:Nif3-like dinuclear metal center hexameric protein n=1 Tax=Paludibacter sp. 221 TaxID=2302939 RepID=UPI0013CF83AF|nr:Nif3-like dinuclear metal center hexameric protein [Paludibacter sp. 221]NDV47243.1 Nif3-like dinuclear metal center hexameric protein [Paludibacter sp. 221]